MARKTKKYVEACSMLGLPIDANIPHEAAYGMLSLRGYEWIGGSWVSGKRNPISQRTVSFRIEAHKDDAEIFADGIATTMELNGLTTLSIKGPYTNRKGGKVRYYVNAKYEVEKE